MKAKVIGIVAGAVVLGSAAVVGATVAHNLHNKDTSSEITDDTKQAEDTTETKVVIVETEEETEVVITNTEEIISTEVVADTEITIAEDGKTDAEKTKAAEEQAAADAATAAAAATSTGTTGTAGTTGTTGSISYENTTPGEYVVFSKGVNVRSYSNGPILGGYDMYKEINVLEVKDGWGRVNYCGTEGWVYMNYLVDSDSFKQIDATVASGKDYTEPVTYIVTSNVLSVRSNPDSSATESAVLNSGDKVKVTEVDGSWGKVTVNGVDGWIDMNNVQKK